MVLTWDHVFPRSWYPDGARLDLAKWQIPCCQPCNAAYGALENDLRIRLGLCVDPLQAAASGILEKAQRAIDPSAAKSDRDRDARANLRRKITDKRLIGDMVPTTGIYPGFHDRWNQPKEELAALTISKASFEKLTQKLVRGITFLNDKRFIEPPYEITFYVLDPAQPFGPLSHVLDQGTVYAHEPGVKVTRTVAHDDELASIFEIEIWGTLKLHACVLRDDA